MLFTLLALPASAPDAFEFSSVGSAPAILFDTPSQRGRKLFIAPRGMPLEVILAQGDWVRVRDVKGEFFWVEKKALVERRMVVSITVAAVRSRPEISADVIFRVQPDVLLEVVEPPRGAWLRVRHEDGVAGYISANEVWGH